MTEMMEKVAEAIWRSEFEGEPAIAWEDAGGYNFEREEYRHAARAAIRALMEPTHSNLCAGVDSIDPNDALIVMVRKIHTAVLMAALGGRDDARPCKHASTRINDSGTRICNECGVTVI